MSHQSNAWYSNLNADHDDYSSGQRSPNHWGYHQIKQAGGDKEHPGIEDLGGPGGRVTVEGFVVWRAGLKTWEDLVGGSEGICSLESDR